MKAEVEIKKFSNHDQSFQRKIQFVNMRLMYVLLSVFVLKCCFAQNEITYQPDSVYKINKVKARVIMYNYSRYYTKKADLFDHDGRLIDHMDFDTSGTHLLWRHSKIYGTNNLITKEIFYDYRRYDSVTKKYIRRDVADTQISKIEYDSVRHVIHKTSFTKSGTKTYEFTSIYDSKKIIQNWFFEDGAVETKTSWWEKDWIEKRVVDTIHLSNGNIKSVEVNYKNYFDNPGRIIRSKVKKTGSLNDYQNDYFFKEIEFVYSKIGLLIKKNYTDPIDNSDWTATQIFDYKYW